MKTISIDFGGVIHAYSDGLQDGIIYDEPVEGAMEAIRHYVESGFKVVIFTAREAQFHSKIAIWIKKYIPETIQWIKDEKLLITNVKQPALCYIDDRGIRFTNWESTKLAVNAMLEVEA